MNTDRGFLARHADVSIPAAAVVAMLLGALTFDFAGQGVGSALALHLGIWLAKGLFFAVVAAVVLARLDGPVVAVLGGLVAGALVAFATGATTTEDLLFHLGAGVVVGALVQLFTTLERADVAPASLMALVFLLVINTFWIAKSIKKGLLIGWYKDPSHAPFQLFGATFTGAGVEQIAKVCNLVAAILAMTLFTWLSRRLQRERLVFLFAGCFAVLFLYFWRHLAEPDEGLVWWFYLGGDLFNTIMVSTFFAFLNDSVVPEQAKRIYALVGFGGVLGGVLGSTTVRSLQKSLGDRPLALLCATATVGIAVVAGLAAQRFSAARSGAGTRQPPAPLALGANPALEGARLVYRSRYLLCIVAIVGIYEFCSATLDYQWTSTHERLLADPAAIRQHQATVYAITNWTAMLVQLLVTGTLLRRFGVGAALLVLPLAFLGNSTLFLLFPTVLFAAGLSVSDNSLNYSVNQSARESLYVPTTRDEKYKAKAFIDMFVQRFAKVVAVGLALVFNVIDPAHARYLSIPVLLLGAVWIAAARYAGRRHRELTAAP